MRGKDVEEDALGRTYVSVLHPRLYRMISERPAAAARRLSPTYGLVMIPDKEGLAVNQMIFRSRCDISKS